MAALLDGELPAEEQSQLQEHIRLCEHCAADLAQQRAARAALRDLAASLSTPPALEERVRAALARTATPASSRVSVRRRLLLLGSLAAVVALVAAIVWLRSMSGAPDTAMLMGVVDAHQRETLRTTPVSFSSSDAAAVAAWARSRTGLGIEVPSLDSAGYHLLGVRTAPTIAPKAISLVYQGEGGRVTCTIVPVGWPLVPPLRPSTAPTRAIRLQGSSLASWNDGDSAYVLVADLDLETVLRLARLAARSD